MAFFPITKDESSLSGDWRAGNFFSLEVSNDFLYICLIATGEICCEVHCKVVLPLGLSLKNRPVLILSPEEPRGAYSHSVMLSLPCCVRTSALPALAAGRQM